MFTAICLADSPAIKTTKNSLNLALNPGLTFLLLLPLRVL